MPIFIEKGDITTYQVDAVVNAANRALCGGGGVDGAVHRAAGQELLSACRQLGSCDTGKAVYTKGYQLSATYIIHTVGPVWYDGSKNEQQFLCSCYKEVMKIANSLEIKSIAFPSISTGAYRFPVQDAVKIAMKTLEQELLDSQSVDNIYIVCFDEKTYNAYLKEQASK